MIVLSELKAEIDSTVTNETAVGGITQVEVGGLMKKLADFTAEQIAANAPTPLPYKLWHFECNRFETFETFESNTSVFGTYSFIQISTGVFAIEDPVLSVIPTASVSATNTVDGSGNIYVVHASFSLAPITFLPRIIVRTMRLDGTPFNVDDGRIQIEYREY